MNQSVILARAKKSRPLYLAVDAERERISLGVKQLEKDPFSNFVAENPKGTIVKGYCTEC